MWIHHSCGSLMKIQMPAAARITVHLPMRLGVPAQAHELDEEEEVLEGVREDEAGSRALRELEGETPIIR